jgi:hypothetical protein
MSSAYTNRPLTPIGKRELIVVSSRLQSAPSVDVDSLSAVLGQYHAELQPLFGAPQELQAEAAALAPSSEGEIPDLSIYYNVQAPDASLERLAAELRARDLIDAAYIKPAGEAPIAAPLDMRRLDEMLPRTEDAPPTTPDFVGRQGYLEATPTGIDARFAWTQPGGGGAGVNIIDCEWSWNTTHEDLATNQGGVVVGAATADDNHGTAVSGEMGGDRNAIGILGICPDAFIRYAAFSLPTASVIRQAANLLNPGDLLLLEIHRSGPGASGTGQDGFIAVEWWPDDYDAIRYACSRGVVVVEAAGNGARDLDNPIYDTPATGFPASWSNPFRRGARDSGAILVGAGAPPPGTHGSNWGADRSRLDFSNYGTVVDAQGWGREVTTTGYGDLQGGANRNLWYTDKFSGTSSASPIVTGALACVQGILRAQGRIPLSPARARELLRSTGTPQQDEPGRPATQRIGNRPDLMQLIAAATQTSSFSGTQFTGSLSANQTSRWFTFGWPAHWHVIWTVMPTSPFASVAQLRWRVLVQRASFEHITYWIEVTNLTGSPITFEGRYNVLGW